MVNLVLNQKSYNLTISIELENKIRYYCNKLPNREWSGILFYTYEGSFKDNLTITGKDLYLMDIGNYSKTEFSMSPEVINYMTNNDLLDCQIGLIHSHHTMSTEFSNTDLDTLKKEGIDTNNFVSLIVNNQGNYNAVITRQLKKKDINYKLQSTLFDTVETTLINSKEIITIEYFILKVVKEVNSNYEDRLNELLQINSPTTDIKYLKYVQLITGDIFADSSIDIKLFTPYIEELYSNRFNYKEFCLWAETIVDYLVHSSEEAQYILNKLYSLKPNKYIEYYINLLTDFI